MTEKKVNTTEVKNWVMFLFALGLLYGMFRRGDELGPWWTLIIGAMLSLTTLVVAVENIMSLIKRGTDGKNPPGGTGSGDSPPPNSSSPEASRTDDPSNRKPGGDHQSQVALGWDAGLRGRRRAHPGAVQRHQLG